MPRSFQQADLCSGWRSDGTMMIAVYAGEPLPFEPITDVPQVPENADGWPDVEIPTPGLRRYRRIDVVPDNGVWRIDAWFRDTYRNSDGECGALHEYTVHAVADAVDHTLLEVSAIPARVAVEGVPGRGRDGGQARRRATRRPPFGGAEGLAGDRELHAPHQRAARAGRRPASRGSLASA